MPAQLKLCGQCSLTEKPDKEPSDPNKGKYADGHYDLFAEIENAHNNSENNH